MSRFGKRREMMSRMLRKRMREVGKWEDILDSAKENPRNPVARYLLEREKEKTPQLVAVKSNQPLQPTGKTDG